MISQKRKEAASAARRRKYQSLAHRVRSLTARRHRGAPTPCWEWRGTLRGRTGNYPRINVWCDCGHRQFAAHRLSKVLTEVGADEHLAAALYDLYRLAGFELDHECENPSCVRPSHLTWRDRDEHLQITLGRRRAKRDGEETCPA